MGKKITCIVSGSLRGYRWGLVIDPNAWRCSFSRDWEVWTHLRAWAGSLYWSNVNWVAVGKVDRTCGGKRAGWPPDTNWFLYARTTCKHGETVNYRGFGGCWWGRKTHHGENTGSQQHCEANQPDPRQGLCGSEASPAAALSETKGKKHCSKCMCFSLSYNALCIRKCCAVHMHTRHIKAFTLSVCKWIWKSYALIYIISSWKSRFAVA